MRYCRRCYYTGKGMNEGYVLGDVYACEEKYAEEFAIENGYNSFDEMYEDDSDSYFFTEWDAEYEIEEQGFYYTEKGKMIEI